MDLIPTKAEQEMKEQLKEVQQVQERRGGSQELIDHMLKERNQLLTLLLQVSSDSSKHEPDQLVADLEEFIQVLVDYIAAGHFGLYERIAAGKERRKAVSDLAVKIYPRIEQTTEIALAFDEKYNPENENREINHFPQDVSMLGEELTNRIELEDQLIQLLLEPKT
jgi:regulator of sigma D